MAGKVARAARARCLAHLAVQFLATGEQQSVVGDFLDQRMLERVFLAAAGDRTAPGTRASSSSFSSVARRSSSPITRGQHVAVEGAADHAGGLQDLPLAQRLTVHARHDHFLDGRRDHDVVDLRRRAEAPVDGLDGPFIDQRPHHLLDVERIAVRLLLDHLARRVRDVALAEQVVEQAPGRFGVQRSQLDLEVPLRVLGRGVRADLPGGPLEARPEQVHEQDRVVFAEREQGPQQLDRGEVGPVQIVHHDDHRSSATAGAQQLHDASERHLLERRALDSLDPALRGRVERQAEQRRDERQHVVRFGGERVRITASNLARALASSSSSPMPGPGSTQVGDRMEALVLAGRDGATLAPRELRGPPGWRRVPSAAGTFRDRPRRSRSTIPPLPERSRDQRVAQLLELTLAPDQSREEPPLGADPRPVQVFVFRQQRRTRAAPWSSSPARRARVRGSGTPRGWRAPPLRRRRRGPSARGP